MGLSVIHFSDIHIQNEKDAVFKKKQEIINACTNSISNKDYVIITVSGDIAFSGQEQQYTLAAQFFNEIVGSLYKKGINNVQMVYVPGNHDCDFSKKSSVRDILIEKMKCDDVDSEIYQNAISVQDNYFLFAASETYSDKMIQLCEYSHNGNKYGFLLINTAWMSQLHEKYGKIVIPKTFMEQVRLSEYSMVLGVYHHPSNWISAECRNDFIEYINNNCDCILVGHEHMRSEYQMITPESSSRYYKAKELQNTDDSNDSGFNILSFNDELTSVVSAEFNWDGEKYVASKKQNVFSKNKAVEKQILLPNDKAKEWLLDIGFTVNHFAKEDVSLIDLFVWPDVRKSVHYSDRTTNSKVRNGVLDEIKKHPVSIVYGPSISGKTAVAKMLYMSWVDDGQTCLYLKGSEFRTSEREAVLKVIDRHFEEQYNQERLHEYRVLPKEKKTIIVDEFDTIAMVGNRRSEIVDILADVFENVLVVVSTEIEMTSFLMADSITKQDNIVSYEILPFGNSKRKELVTKWYSLSNYGKTDDEIDLQIDKGIDLLNRFIGNGAGFVPAYPIYLINALQNMDASFPNNASRYGFLYETMIQKSLTKVADEYKESGSYNIDIELISSIAFSMLERKRSFITGDEIENITAGFNTDKKLKISASSLLIRMMRANVVVADSCEGTDTYRFKYPYIFYFFAGRYIAYNVHAEAVKNIVELMSSKLYIEAYGNIMIFVCHFANNTDIIETILLNAYETLGKYPEFDYFDKHPNGNDIEDVIPLVTRETMGNNSDVGENKERRLERMDDMGVNDGEVSETCCEIEEIDEEATELEKDMASVSAALKTMDVLGQIIQNYPGTIDGELKTDIIKEIYSLGMRTIEAISENMDGIQEELARFVFERAQHEKKSITMDGCKEIAKKISNVLTLGMVRGMVSKIALSINSKHLVVATKETLDSETSVFAKLVLIDLQFNCFKQPSFDLVEKTKKGIEIKSDTTSLIAAGVLQQIVVTYLDYNKCDYKLRQRLCGLFKLSAKHKRPAIETR